MRERSKVGKFALVFYISNQGEERIVGRPHSHTPPNTPTKVWRWRDATAAESLGVARFHADERRLDPHERRARLRRRGHAGWPGF